MILYLASAVLGGVFSTLLMDIGSMLIRTTGLTAGAPPAIIGKWFMYVLRGRLTHADIVSSPDIQIKMPLALAIHYSIGIVLASVFVAFVAWQHPHRGLFWFAVGFGLITTVLPWFLMFPAMGWGIAGARGPQRFLLTRTSLVNHAFYGLGLGVWMTYVAPLFMRSA